MARFRVLHSLIILVSILYLSSAVPVEDENSIPDYPPCACPRIYRPVCATDKVYNSICEFRCAQRSDYGRRNKIRLVTTGKTYSTLV